MLDSRQDGNSFLDKIVNPFYCNRSVSKIAARSKKNIHKI